MTFTNSARQKAAHEGAKRYMGLTCSKGHTGERYVLSNACVSCSDASRRKHRKDKPELVNERRREYRKNRIEIIRQQERDLRAKDPQKARDKVSRWKDKNKEALKAKAKEKWPEIKSTVMKKKREKYASDAFYALKANVRSRIGSIFRRGGFTKASKVNEILGCNWSELKIHIERQFLRGMTWENRGTAWHIDHIIPIASAKNSEDLRSLCHFTNLRPLWVMENFTKGSKMTCLI